jgi:hypothetical protein
MKLINNTKTKFTTPEGEFGINSIMDFSEEVGKSLSRYKGIDKVEDLEVKPKAKSKSKSKSSD